MSFLPIVTRAMGAGAVSGAALATYAVWEARQYTLRHVELPILPAGMRPLRVLQVSDLHLVPAQRRKREWVRALGDLKPDLVIDSGDNLAHPDAVPAVLDCFAPLLERPGVFVHGSNDYFAPGFRNPLGYLLPDNGKRKTSGVKLPWGELSAGFTQAGWVDFANRRETITVGETTLAFAGVDDPHLGYDDLAAVAGPAEQAADVRIGLTHAPYLRVLDQFAADGYDAIIAGHTHGGQVCLPWGRALATNCDLEPARAKGLHRHPANSRPGEAGSAWLHVSAGLGTHPHLRVRVACRPEATLLTLIPASAE